MCLLSHYQLHIYMAVNYKYKQLQPPEEKTSGYYFNSSDEQQSRAVPCWPKICITIMSLTILVMASVLLWITLHTDQTEVCESADCVDVSAYILRKMNQSVDPCNDFYTYSCGGWEKSTFIPPERAKYDTFAEIHTNNAAIIKRLLDDRSTTYKGQNSSSVAKLKIFYRTCMNVSKIEVDDIGPIQKVIEDVGFWSIVEGNKNLSKNLSDSWDLENTVAKFANIGFSPFFSFSPSPDNKNSSKRVIKFRQSGLTLTNHELYNSTDADKFRKGFMDYAVSVGKLLGGDESTQRKMEAIYNLEKSLAGIFMAKEELIDPESTYNPMTVEEFQKVLGDQFQINVKNLLRKVTGRKIEDSHTVIIETVQYFQKLGPLLATMNQQVLQDYMVWHMVQYIPGYLPQAFVDAAMMLNKVELGTSELSPRWQRCIAKVESAFGFVSAALYVEKAFPPASKAQALKILTGVQEEFIKNLDNLNWMDAATKEGARIKARASGKSVGYPEWILEPSKLDDYYKEANVQEGEFLNNYFSVTKYEVAKMWKEIDQPPNKDDWGYIPSNVNAFYSVTHNQIVLLAGLLQRPYFDCHYPLSFANGAMGSISGHEFTHGYDNTGRKFDKQGNMKDWWSNVSAASFKEHSRCIIDQYSNYTYNGQHLSGEFSLGENIADNGGLKFGYKAYTMARSQLPPEPILPALSLSPEQLFFVGFAQNWCASYTPEYAANAILNDEHSISKFRVLGSVSNMPEFAKAFNCAAGSPLNPSKKCTVW